MQKSCLLLLLLLANICSAQTENKLVGTYVNIVEKIIKNLCIEQFNIQEPAALFALRLVDTEELITDEVFLTWWFDVFHFSFFLSSKLEI